MTIIAIASSTSVSPRFDCRMADFTATSPASLKPLRRRYRACIPRRLLGTALTARDPAGYWDTSCRISGRLQALLCQKSKSHAASFQPSQARDPNHPALIAPRLIIASRTARLEPPPPSQGRWTRCSGRPRRRGRGFAPPWPAGSLRDVPLRGRRIAQKIPSCERIARLPFPYNDQNRRAIDTE